MSASPFDNEIEQLLTQAEALLMDDKPVEALNLLDRARSLQPRHAWMMLFRGVALGQLGRLEEAIEQLIAASDASLEDIDIQVDTARNLSLLEQHQDALVCTYRALALDELDGGAHAVHAEVLERLGRINEAVPSREAALAFDQDDTDSRYYLAVDLCDLGRYQEAAELAQPLFTEFKDDPDIIRLHGACLSYLGQHEEALAIWEELERIEGITSNLLHNRASTLNALGRFDEALQAINEAITLEPQVGMNYYTRGMVREFVGDQQAIEDYLTALTFDPDNLDAVINLVELAPTLNATAIALEGIEALLKTEPSSAKLLYARGRLLMEQGELAAGKMTIQEALGREPSLGVGWYTLSMLNGLLGDYAGAVTAADYALQEFPDDAGLWLNRGQALHELKDFRAAMESYDRAAQLAADDWLPWLHLGRLLLLDLNRPADARAVLHEALRLDPENDHATWMLALALLRLGRQDEARMPLSRLLEQSPDHLWGRLARAALHAQEGNVPASLDDLAVVIEQGYDVRLLQHEPLFAPLWSDARFKGLIRRRGKKEIT